MIATAVFMLWPLLLSLPMLAGMWLASPLSDQYNASVPFQAWSAEWFKRSGHLPLWNPELFGGLPFVAAGSGDIFYPTWLLRFLVPATTAGNLSFFAHYVLAGLFTYLLLRRLHVGWIGSVIGGLSYELSGLIASYPSPGHDGKLFASAMLPLMLLGLVLALRDRRWEGYPLLGLATALTLLGHFQLAYYSLIVAGLFALYLTVEEGGTSRGGERVLRLGTALAAVLIGFGVAAIQILPFFEYIPFSPRAQGYHGFEGSTSYAIPWSHVPEFFIKNFVGSSPQGTYWGTNPIKLHSEYLGLPVVALAVLGAIGWARERRRLVLWVGGIGLLFLLISLGAATPFYKVWWALMPLVKKTRAPGMAFFVVALVTALFAGLGVDRVRTAGHPRAMTVALIIGGLVSLLGITGALGHLAEGFASGIQAATGRAVGAAATADASAILWGAATSGLALAAVALVLGYGSHRLTPRLQALALVLIVGTDLWLNARPFWSYMKPYDRDSLIDLLTATPAPYRVIDLGPTYRGSVLATFDIPQVLGYHGNELRYYDELLGGQGEWRSIGFLPLWDLLAVRYAIAPAEARSIDSIPGFRRVLDTVPILNGDGRRARLFERIAPTAYARVVPGAVKADSATIIPTLVDPRMDYSRIVIFSNDQPVTPEPLKQMPPPSPARAAVSAWEPGRMTVTIDPPPPQAGYLLIAENWYPDWRASVDGRPSPVLRGDYSFITVPVPAAAQHVELTFRSELYERGRAITLVSLAVLLLSVLVTVARGVRSPPPVRHG
ncbi:MAG TPA: YfhO family protein [Gemmatimonadales bacterium]|nr:YfhO family protein [Gemmatimonadales bacterium]